MQLPCQGERSTAVNCYTVTLKLHGVVYFLRNISLMAQATIWPKHDSLQESDRVVSYSNMHCIGGGWTLECDSSVAAAED